MKKEFSLAVKNKWFEHYIDPLLTKKPKGQGQVENLLDLGERAFLNGIGSSEIKAVKAYLTICERIYRDESAREELGDIFSAALSDIEYEATSRLNEAMQNSGKEENWARPDLVMYTALAENYVRSFITPIYYFVHKYYRSKKGGPKSADEYVNVSIAEKEKLISYAKMEVTEADISLLMNGLDLRLRHGGVGHEHWIVLDDDKVEIKLISPSTGSIREKFILTKRELSEKLKGLEKLVWIIRAGFYIFLNNSDLKLKSIKPRTKKGVESFSRTFAKGRVLDLDVPFVWNELKKEISLVIRYTRPSKGSTVEILMPSGAFELIYYEMEMPFKFQILDVLKYVGLFVDQDVYHLMSVVVLRDNEEVLNATYNILDLIRKIDLGDVPKPLTGVDISEKIKITWVGELTVPRGLRDIMVRELVKVHPEYKIL